MYDKMEKNPSANGKNICSIQNELPVSSTWSWKSTSIFIFKTNTWSNSDQFEPAASLVFPVRLVEIIFVKVSSQFQLNGGLSGDQAGKWGKLDFCTLKSRQLLKLSRKRFEPTTSKEQEWKDTVLRGIERIHGLRARNTLSRENANILVTLY